MSALLARFICAAAAFRGNSVDDLAIRTGLSTKHVTQLRSGVRVDAQEANLVLTTLGLAPDPTIRLLAKLAAAHSGQLDELLTVLLLALPGEVPPSRQATGTISCDKLALVLPQSVAVQRRDLVDEVLEGGKKVFDPQYKHAAMFGDVFVAVGLQWKNWKGLRLQFNPATLTKGDRRLVRSFASACPHEQLIISVLDVAIDLGGHPKPASRGHLKTGQS